MSTASAFNPPTQENLHRRNDQADGAVTANTVENQVPLMNINTRNDVNRVPDTRAIPRVPQTIMSHNTQQETRATYNTTLRVHAESITQNGTTFRSRSYQKEWQSPCPQYDSLSSSQRVVH